MASRVNGSGNMIPGQYQECLRCVMDSSDKDIRFNDRGYCNHCSNAIIQINKIKRNINEDPRRLEREVKTLIENREGDFDGIVGVSGGVDSSYLVHILKNAGLKLLAVHVDAGWNSIESIRNINRLVTRLDLELETVVVNWEEMRDLQLAYLKSGVINQDVPQDHAFFGSLFQIAHREKIKNVFTGSNFATESILPRSWGQQAMDGKQLRYIHAHFGEHKLTEFPVTTLARIYTSKYIRRNLKYISPLNWIEYQKGNAIKELEDIYSWENYGGKHRESRFTSFFQDVYLPKRFNIDKRRAHLSSLIVANEITREAAVFELSQPALTPTQQENTLRYVSSKLQIESRELSKLMEMPFVPDSVYPNQKYLVTSLDYLVKVRKFMGF